MLSSAARDGTLVKATCVGCSPARWYHPEDLLRLFGNVPAINLEVMMRCGQCGAHMSIEVTNPLPEVRLKIRLRRIDRIWWVKRVRWREEKL